MLCEVVWLENNSFAPYFLPDLTASDYSNRPERVNLGVNFLDGTTKFSRRNRAKPANIFGWRQEWF